MKILIETERLILRELLPTDVDGLFELDADPEVHRYLGGKSVTGKEQVVAVINFIRQQYADHGIGRWAIIDKKTGDFVGWTGLKFVTEPTNRHQNYYDLGYRLIKRYWGKGLATETAVASLQYAFEKLKLREVYAMADCENAGSNKVLKKVGFTFIETFDLDGTPHNWYRIDKKEFENKKMEPASTDVLDNGPFYHGTKADLKVGDLLMPGFRSNYRPEVVMNHIYFTALVAGAGLAAALAQGEGAERVYLVEPTGDFENDPNVTDKKFPGNPTRSYRSRLPLRIVAEVTDWVRLTP